jgi:uncharacterized membrane protein YkvI
MGVKRGQYGIYGIVLAVVGLIIWAAINPTIQAEVAYGMSYLNSSSMEYILTPFMPSLIPMVIIGYVIITAVIRR